MRPNIFLSYSSSFSYSQGVVPRITVKQVNLKRNNEHTELAPITLIRKNNMHPVRVP